MDDLARALTSTGAIPPGTRLGKYEVLSRLGGGGMAEIYVARSHEAAGVSQWTVIKRILPHLARDPEFLRMFLNEAKITASLQHPNIAHVKEVGRAGEEFFLALELVHGVDLRRILKESAGSRGVPLGPALAIVAAAADALHYAHERGIVHRDVTPSNIMATWEGHTKVLDFGIAKAALTALTRTGTIKGKVGYMSPEQCMAEDVDRRSDVFALGILLWELTLGRRLFKGDSDFAIMNQISLGRAATPTSVDASYPAELERIVMQALAVRPEDRFQTAEAFGRAVGDFGHAQGLRMSAGEVATWMRGLLGDAPPPVSAAELDAIPVQRESVVVPMSWSMPGRSRRGRMLAIGVIAGVIGIAIGGVVTATATTTSAASTSPSPDPSPSPRPDPSPSPSPGPSPGPSPSPSPRLSPGPGPSSAAAAVSADAEVVAAKSGAKRKRPKSKRAKPAAASSLLPPSRRGAQR